MIKRTLTWMVMIAALGVAACESESVKVLKSPCASLEDGPCGPKRTLSGNRQA